MAIVWLAITYNLPATPSRNRVYVWRKLKEMGAEYFRQGMSILPNTSENFERFSKLAQKVLTMGGESTLVEMRFVNKVDENAMVEQFRRQTQEEYRRLLKEAEALRAQPPEGETKVKRLLRQLDKVRRSSVPEGLTDDMEEGFQQVIETLWSVGDDFSSQLRDMLGDIAHKDDSEK